MRSDENMPRKGLGYHSVFTTEEMNLGRAAFLRAAMTLGPLARRRLVGLRA